MAQSSSRLSLEKATIIVDETLAEARRLELRPMAVAVLDDGGHLKAFKREDGASILRPQIAIGKAWGSLGMGGSSRSIADRLNERPTFLAALTALADGKVVPAAGGLLIRDGDGRRRAGVLRLRNAAHRAIQSHPHLSVIDMKIYLNVAKRFVKSYPKQALRIVIPAKAGIHGWGGANWGGVPAPPPPGFPLARE